MSSDDTVSRRQFLGTSTGALGVAVGSRAAAAEQQAGQRRPNVVVFFTDQQRWDSVGVNGSPMDLTPNLDRVAKGGVRFEHAFTSQPVCGPARSTLQTGKYPTTTGVVRNNLTLKDDEQTLAHYFKRAGYQTGYIGKWHLGGTWDKPIPLERRGGYDEYWAASDLIEVTSDAFGGRIFDAANRPVEFKKYRADFLTDLAVDFIRQKRQNPFFLFVSYLEPHHDLHPDRYTAPEGYADRYRNNFHIPQDLAPYPGDWKSWLPDYYGIIARVDECFGRVVQELADQKLVDNTILAFTTDHGCHFRTRNAEYKRSCHDASIHIPIMIHGPGLEAGRVVPGTGEPRGPAAHSAGRGGAPGLAGHARAEPAGAGSGPEPGLAQRGLRPDEGRSASTRHPHRALEVLHLQPREPALRAV